MATGKPMLTQHKNPTTHVYSNFIVLLLQILFKYWSVQLGPTLKINTCRATKPQSHQNVTRNHESQNTQEKTWLKYKIDNQFCILYTYEIDTCGPFHFNPSMDK